MVDDVNTFAGLAARRVPVGILDHATRGKPERSARYRDVLAAGGHPARAARGVRHPRARLGRGAHRPPRGERRVRAARRRRARRRRPARSPRASAPRCASTRRAASTGVEAPGLVVLGPRRRGRADHAAGARAARLDRARPAGLQRRRRCPPRVLALASFVRGAPDGGPGRRDVVTVPGRDGWVTLHALAARAAATAASRSSSSARRGARSATRPARGVRRDRARARGRHPARPRPVQRRDRRGARPLPAHRRGPRQEPLREARRRLAPGARRPRLPRRVPARGRARRRR